MPRFDLNGILLSELCSSTKLWMMRGRCSDLDLPSCQPHTRDDWSRRGGMFGVACNHIFRNPFSLLFTYRVLRSHFGPQSGCPASPQRSRNRYDASYGVASMSRVPACLHRSIRLASLKWRSALALTTPLRQQTDPYHPQNWEPLGAVSLTS